MIGTRGVYIILKYYRKSSDVDKANISSKDETKTVVLSCESTISQYKTGIGQVVLPWFVIWVNLSQFWKTDWPMSKIGIAGIARRKFSAVLNGT